MYGGQQNLPKHIKKRFLTKPMSTSNTVNLFGLFRHGETEWNVEKRIQGRGNSPLTRNGISQLQLWAAALQESSWQRILVSPQLRAVQTAEIFNASLKLPVTVADGLQEQNWGDWEGATLQDLQTRQAKELQTQIEAGWEFTPPNGESRRRVLARAKEVLDTAADSWPGDNILIISHQSVIKCLIYSALGSPFLPDAKQKLLKNRLHVLTLQDSLLAAHRINITRS